MVELKTKITTTGVLYIPKELREAFTRDMKIISNATAAVFFSADATYENVLKSLQIIERDIEHRMELSKKRNHLSKPYVRRN
jgi:bifunctional DNA-binding transcriptional regulator/antitoxin component of YhaV-PrlF toxin-antitoxin module